MSVKAKHLKWDGVEPKPIDHFIPSELRAAYLRSTTLSGQRIVEMRAFRLATAKQLAQQFYLNFVRAIDSTLWIVGPVMAAKLDSEPKWLAYVDQTCKKYEDNLAWVGELYRVDVAEIRI